MRADAELSDAKLFHPTVPAEWRVVCRLLLELEALVTAPVPEAEKTSDARRATAGRLRERLLAEAAVLAEATPARLGNHKLSRQLSEAVLLWTDFAAAGGEIVRDTFGSATLAHFPVDLPNQEQARAVVRRAVQRLFGWTAAELEALEAQRRHRTSNFPLKHAIARALSRYCPTPREVFRCLYGDLPLRDTDVNVVITSVMVFVLLPHRDLALDVPDWAQRPEGERAVITAWLAQLKKAAMLTRYIRFPAFGLFDRERVDPAMLAAVTAEVGQSLGQRLEVELVERTLETMVVIVPSGEAEKYFVHDMWGHGWQETLLDFEWFMDDLALLGKPIGPTTGTRLQEGEVTLAHAFAGGALHRDKLCAVVEANLRARIQRGLNVVVAENLADLIEHKFTRQRGQDRALPSSSLLPESTLKIDLSLQDVRRMVGLWARPWRRLFTEREDFERLRGELIAAGVPAAGLDAALGEALATIAERFGAAFEPNLLHPGDEGPVPTTVLGRVLLGVVSLDGALTKFLADGDARFASKPGLARWQCPPACVDLLALVLGYVYEQNRELNIWHLDELLRNELWPALVDLEAAIAAELAA